MSRNDRDGQIISAILGGSALSGRPIKPGGQFFGGWSWSWEKTTLITNLTTGPCCAVGAGVLYAGLDPLKVRNSGALDAFARAYRVSFDYASGVSDGFEANQNGESGSIYDRDDRDYVRGYAVGVAVRVAIESEAQS